MAEGTAPAIEAALRWVDSFDLTRAGENIGQFISGVIQIFREGSFADLISQSIYAGFTAGFKMIRPLIGMLADSMFMLLGSVGVSFVSAIEWGVLRLQQLKGGDIAPSFDAVWTRNMQKATSAYEGMTGERRNDMAEAARESFDSLKPIFEKIENAAKRAFTGMQGTERKSSEETRKITLQTKENRRSSEVTDWEKFGLIFGKGGPSPVADASRQTAAHTKQMSIYLKDIREGIKKLTGQTPDLAMT